MKLTNISCFILFTSLLCVNAKADVIVFEDFEDATITYTSSVADNLSDVAGRNYFGRISPGTATPPVDVSYSNTQGTGYYGVQDTDATSSGNITLIELNWTGIDTSNFEDLSLSWFVGEDDANDGNEDWDTTSSFRIDVQLDNGGFNTIFQIESENAADPNNPVGGDQTNELPRIDTDFNSVGDGAEITDVMTQFTSLLTNASTVDIRVTFEDLDTGDEDLAFDNLLLEGTFNPVPEPGSAIVLGAAFVGLFCRRRKKA